MKIALDSVSRCLQVFTVTYPRLYLVHCSHKYIAKNVRDLYFFISRYLKGCYLVSNYVSDIFFCFVLAGS